ncbi:MAG: hypothetical protein JWN41_844 [Thermoleophilia bacterium]|nr:hypothetical protein [Thermoleophilia bacterium]
MSTTHISRPTSHMSRRGYVLMTLPVLAVLATAVVTNLGGGISRDAHAATVNITASMGTEKHLATNICTGGSGADEISGASAGAGGTIAFGTMSLNTGYLRPCSINFGSTNSGTVAMQASAASATFGWTGFAAQGACATKTDTSAKVGIDANVTGSGSSAGTLDCATALNYQSIPTTPTTACQVTGVSSDATCTLTVMVTTGTAAAGSVSNTSLTVNAA